MAEIFRQASSRCDAMQWTIAYAGRITIDQEIANLCVNEAAPPLDLLIRHYGALSLSPFRD